MERDLELVITSLNISKYAFLHPTNGKVRIVIATLINVIRLYYFYCCVQMIRNSNGNIEDIIDAVGTLTTFTQGIAKLIPLLFYKDYFLKVIEQTKRFWKPSINIPSVERSHRIGKKATNIYRTVITVILVMFFILPIFSKKLIFPMWVPEFQYAFWLLLISQYFVLIIDVVCVVAIDSFFVSACINIVTQFYLLNAAFAKLDDYKDNELLKAKLKSCIRHHTLLLEQMETLKKCYSISLMVVYLITIYTYCTQLYGVIERTTPVAVLLAIYCFPADAATQIALETSLCINESKWYSHSLQIQKYMPLTIMRSQHPFRFTAGGLVDIDKTAFVRIFRTGFSFYTLIKNVQDKI